jgi:hypothetical protein
MSRSVIFTFVIPAKAGTHISSWLDGRWRREMGPRFRGDDEFGWRQ